MIRQYKELVSYIVFGGLTVAINLLSYSTMRLLQFSVIVATILAWITAVIFAFFTNKYFVFKKNSTNKSVQSMEFIKFSVVRLLTLALELFLTFVLIEYYGLKEIYCKLFIQFVVIVINYLFSKMYIFR